MPRRPGVLSGGRTAHVIQRGNNRQICLASDQFRLQFEELTGLPQSFPGAFTPVLYPGNDSDPVVSDAASPQRLAFGTQ